MEIRTFVKGEDDFGRTPTGDKTATFEAILYILPRPGDIMLYLYPETRSHLLYKIDEIKNTFTKDLPYIVTGTMTLLKLNDQPTELYNSICLAMNNRVH